MSWVFLLVPVLYHIYIKSTKAVPAIIMRRIMMHIVDVPDDVVGHHADEDGEDAEASDDIVGHQAGVPPLT